MIKGHHVLGPNVRGQARKTGGQRIDCIKGSACAIRTTERYSPCETRAFANIAMLEPCRRGKNLPNIWRKLWADYRRPRHFSNPHNVRHRYSIRTLPYPPATNLSIFVAQESLETASRDTFEMLRPQTLIGHTQWSIVTQRGERIARHGCRMFSNTWRLAQRRVWSQ